VVRDVSRLDCKVWPKLRTFQNETPAETPLLVVTTRREGFKRTRRQLRNVDEPPNNRPAYIFPTYTDRVLLKITHLPYRFDRMSIRQSFVCYLVLPPARQSATSGVNMRSTLGKSLLREEVHETTSRMDTWGVRCHRGIGYCFWGRGYDDDNNKKKSLRTYPYGLEGFLAAGSAFPLENETMTKCMQLKDQIAYRCPLGLKPPGVMNCVCVCVYHRRRRAGQENFASYCTRNRDPICHQTSYFDFLSTVSIVSTWKTL
jgi:hypothetical protein